MARRYKTHLDLTAAGGTSAGAGTSTGDKLALYLAGSSGYSIGIQSSALVVAIPAAAKFSVRVASGSGAMTSGAEVAGISGAGIITANGAVVKGAETSSRAFAMAMS
jgi:hypothetical protein